MNDDPGPQAQQRSMLVIDPSPVGRSRSGARVATAVLSFGLVANLVPLMTFAATLHEIAADWGLNATESGWIGGIYFAGYAVAVPVLASATDRMDGRRVYVASALLGAVASLAFSFWANEFWVALILRFLGGIGHSPRRSGPTSSWLPNSEARTIAIT